MASRKKTTLSLDGDVLRAVKIAAAREDKAEYQVVEDALREHLGLGLLERIRAEASMTETEAMKLAIAETHAVRRARRARRA